MPTVWWLTGGDWWIDTSTATSAVAYPIYTTTSSTMATSSTTNAYIYGLLNQQTASAVYPSYVQQQMAMYHQALEAQQAAGLNQAQMAQAQLQAQERVAQRRAVDERRHNTDAAQRARALLLKHLSEEQRESLRVNNFFIVEGRSGVRYRVDGHHLIGNVGVLARQLGGEVVSHRLCAHLDTRVIPLGDHLLAQKLMLEGDEDAFLRVANRHAA